MLQYFFGNLILFKKYSGNLEYPTDEEIPFLNEFKYLGLNDNNQKEEKIFLTKECNDQYNCYKTMYIFFIKKDKNKSNKSKNAISYSKLFLSSYKIIKN